MKSLVEKIHQWSATEADKIALVDDHQQLNYRQVLTEVENLSVKIKGHSVALLMNNCINWALIDLSLLFSQKCCIPIADFFSDTQIQHSLQNAQAELLITDQEKRVLTLDLSINKQEKINLLGKTVYLFHLIHKQEDRQLNTKQSEQQASLKNIRKVTYTSGSTGSPKGVMLDEQAIEDKIKVLAQASQINLNDKVLSLLPLSTLLENIAGLYVGLYSGASVYLYSPETTGLIGSSQLDSKKLATIISITNPSGFILIPQLLAWLIHAVKNGFALPANTRFIAVGGAPVSIQLLSLCQQLKIPVYQGYGLSEACSVVALNNQENNKIGSVGQILEPHQLKISNDGEILIKNNLFQGYINEESLGKLQEQSHQQEDYYRTGDLGYLDKENYLFIQGRKKNIINTSYGRNISPEWIEKELEVIPVVFQAVIYGHARPFIIALIVLHTGSDQSQLDKYLKQLNQSLPDYAQIKNYLLISERFSLQNKQLTGTERPVRAQIYKDYEHKIKSLYES